MIIRESLLRDLDASWIVWYPVVLWRTDQKNLLEPVKALFTRQFIHIGVLKYFSIRVSQLREHLFLTKLVEKHHASVKKCAFLI